MILDLFIYIIQFYINQNTFLPGFIIRKDLFYLHETKNYVYLFVSNKAQKNKETFSLFVLRYSRCNHRCS